MANVVAWSHFESCGDQGRFLRLESGKAGKKEDPDNYWLVSIATIPRKVKEQIILEAVSKNIMDKKMTGSSLVGFSVRKSSVTNLVSLYAKMTGSVAEERVVDVVYVDFDEAFDSVS